MLPTGKRGSFFNELGVQVIALPKSNRLNEEITAPQVRLLGPEGEQLGVVSIRDALAHTGGNRTAAARLLGISRASLYDRLAAQGDASEFQTAA